MKKPTFITSVFLLFLSSGILGAKNLSYKEFKVFGKKVYFELPSDWKTVNKEIGVPLKLLGPKYKGRRPVITMVPIDAEGRKVELKDPAKAIESYKKSRLSWLQKFNGNAIKFNPIKTYKVNEKEFNQFGYLYSFNGVNFEENSLYVWCDNNTYHLKTLVQVEHSQKWERLVKQITDSFQCKGPTKSKKTTKRAKR
jgi:hypothetical protein